LGDEYMKEIFMKDIKINKVVEISLMMKKKLYEEGYLERGSGKIPFRYSIKKEMETLLQKSESPTI